MGPPLSPGAASMRGLNFENFPLFWGLEKILLKSVRFKRENTLKIDDNVPSSCFGPLETQDLVVFDS